ncbi:MAG: RDD family protein [Planctomycetota bacterium]
MSLTSVNANVQTALSLSGPVIYRREDYVGAFRHLVIFAVDSFVIAIVIFPLGSLPSLLVGQSGFAVSSSLLMTLPLALAWCYLAVLKPSRIRSPGYWVADAKIVTIDGQRPTPYRMTLRLMWVLMWVMGWPISLFFDLVWTTIDDERQMLRDLFAETRLIRNKAKPIGAGRISYPLYTAVGLTLHYASVRAKATTTVNPPAEVTPPTALPTALPKHNVVTAMTGSPDLSIVQCPKCAMRVVPKTNGLCPSCQTQISDGP